MRFVLAYLDPGSGSIIIQAVIAGIVAIPVLFRNRIAAFVRRARGGGSSSAATTDAAAGRPDDTAR